MSTKLAVFINDARVGTVTRLDGGRLRFDYNLATLLLPEATPLSLSMPFPVPSHPNEVITPWLWGLLPDNERVLRSWARQFHASPSSPFSILSTPVGEDCAGAVRFIPEGRAGETSAKGNITWLSEDDVGQRIRDLKVDSTAWLGRSFTGQFSLAGAQAKTALLYDDGRWGEPSGDIPTTHILKPAIDGFDGHAINEHLCLEAARKVGIPAAATQIIRLGGEPVLLVDRYDRFRTDEGHLSRLHQEDLCQALSVHPDRKYQREGGPDPRQIAELFRKAMPHRQAEDTVRRFADALIWNWLIAGTDAHAKNYSLLLAGRQVALAPLYDVASALPYGTHERKLRSAMKIGSSYRIFPDFDRWPTAARNLSLDPEELHERVRDLASEAPQAFAEVAGAPSVAALEHPLPRRLVDLVAARCERCLDSLGAS